MENQLKTIQSIRLKTTSEKLWSALTEPEHTKVYLYNCGIQTDFIVGNEVTWEGEFQGEKAFLTGKLLKYIPLSVFQYSMIDPKIGNPENPDDYVHVTYDLKDEGDTVLLTIVSETFDGDATRAEHIRAGWEAYALPLLTSLVARLNAID